MALLALLPSRGLALEVGVTSAVNSGAFATPPEAPQRTLVIGSELLFEEVVETDADGQAQILFLDRSSLTLSANARVVIDRFVYDPDDGTGALAMNLSQGLMRFVGGALSKQNGQVTVVTPSATIGIRGGGTLIEVDPATRETSVTFLVGTWAELFFSDGSRRRLTVPGTQQTIPFGATAETLPPLGRTTQAGLVGSLQRLEGRRGRTAGARDVPTDDRLAGADVVLLGSGLGPGGDPRVPGGRPDGEPVAGQGDPGPGDPVLNAAVDGVALIDGIQDTLLTGQEEVGLQGRLLTSPPRYVTSFGFPSFERPTLDAGLLGGMLDRFGGPLSDIRRDADTITFVDPSGHEITLPRPTGPMTFATLDTGVPGYPTFSGGANRLADGALEYYYGTSDRRPNRGFFLFAGTPTPLSGQIPTERQVRRYHVHSDPLQGGDLIPFTPPQFGFDRDGAGVSDLYIIEPTDGVLGQWPGLEPDEPGLSTGFLQASVSIEGRRRQQRSMMTAALGDLDRWFNPDYLHLVHTFEGTYRTSSRSTADFLLNGVTGSMPGETASFFGPDLDAFVIGTVRPRVSPSGEGRVNWAMGTVYDMVGDRPGPLRRLGDLTTFGFLNPAELVETVPDVSGSLADDRQELTLTGFAAGIAEYSLGFQRPEPVPIASEAFSIDIFPEDNGVLADLSLVTPAAEDVLIYLPFGDGYGGPTDTYIDNDTFAARQSLLEPAVIYELDDDGDPTGETVELGRLSTALLLPATLAEDTDWLSPRVNLCECEFLQWGWWSAADLNLQEGVRGSVHMATWAAGVAPQIAEIPLSGTAVYQGHAIGNVVRGPHSYIAAGNYRQVHDFATRTSRFRISNFDGMVFRGRLEGALDDPGVLESTRIRSPDLVNIDPDVSGAEVMFVHDGLDPVGGVVGQFGIAGDLPGSGRPYGAFGTIAAGQVALP